MGFIERLFKPLQSRSIQDRAGYWIKVRCSRCDELIQARIDLNNELSIEYGEEEDAYICRKVLMGEKLCFQKIEVVLKFDSKRNLIERQITGGVFEE